MALDYDDYLLERIAKGNLNLTPAQVRRLAAKLLHTRKRKGYENVDEERKECLGCKRQYGHLNTCPIQKMHDKLDEQIKKLGPDKVMRLLFGLEIKAITDEKLL